MARQYSSKTFIRRVPNDLLKQYFARDKIDLAIDWDKLDEADPDPLDAAIQKLADKKRAVVDSDFTVINELAYSKGASAILEHAALSGEDWADQFGELENDYARAFWTFLNHRLHFEVAGAFHDMSRYGGWWRRQVGRRLKSPIKGKAKDKFSAELRSYYRRQVGGRFCKVDAYQRNDPVRCCYFAYPEGMATSDLGYDDTGKFRRQPHRSALEVIFVYKPEEGLLELHATGGKEIEEELARIFCTTILGLKGLPDDSGQPQFNLECLKDPDFPFETSPKDGIEDVELKLLRLDLPTDPNRGAGRRIVLSATSSLDGPNAVHQLLVDAINPKKVPLDDVVLGQAKLTFVFRAVGNSRTKRLTFEITYPDRCTLKDDSYDLIARKYLKQWGIARD